MMSTEQRVAMRSRWEAYQEMLTTSAEASGGNAPAASDTPVQGGVPVVPAAPALPLDPNGTPQPHRPRVFPWPYFNAAFARPIQRKEILSNPAAMKALTAKADKLKSRNTWDISSVREWSDVSREAKGANRKVHVGRIFPIVVE